MRDKGERRKEIRRQIEGKINYAGIIKVCLLLDGETSVYVCCCFCESLEVYVVICLGMYTTFTMLCTSLPCESFQNVHVHR